MYDLLRNKQNVYSSGEGRDCDVVLSSRVRLARNFSDYPFVVKENDESASKVVGIMQKFCQKNNEYALFKLSEMSEVEKEVLMQKHLVSVEHIKQAKNRAVVLSEDEKVSIMVNEEDHLRLQCFANGLDLTSLWQKASLIDDEIEKIAPFAFDDKYGYLTCCPTNIGTGLRASVMVHLPALKMMNGLGILNKLSSIGMTVRGLYGEGSEASGSMYQISNQLTLGLSEEDVLNNLENVVQEIIKQERNARKYLYEHNKDEMEDSIMRALGTLRYAKMLSSSECLELISKVRLGVCLGIVKEFDLKTISGLYLLIQSGYLKLINKKDMSAHERDVFRADMLKDYLKRGEINV